MVAPAVAGMASVMTVGGVLAASGLFELLVGVRDGKEPHRGLLLASGVLSLAVGLVMVARPAVGIVGLTLLVAAFFLGAGLHALIAAISGRYPGWGWDVTFGVVSIGLGVTTLLWPASKLLVLGTLVGIAIVVRGATMIATELDRAARTRAPATGVV
jgi:uncharacterized membrane protein HdeD (DUF308 family)